MNDARDWEPAEYRAWLSLQARLLQRDPRLRGRLDESDLVQETLTRAHTARAQCRGTTDPERLAWLQQVLHSVVLDAQDYHHAAKRDVALEQSIQNALADSSARLDAFFHGTEALPSKEAMRKELRLDAAAALQRLSPEQREAVIAHDIEGLSLRAIAELSGVPKSTIADRLVQGRAALARLLAGHQ